MELLEPATFLNYLDSVHLRTRRVILCIPPAQLEWRAIEKRFSYGDIVRHLAGIERDVYAELAIGNSNRYKGHEETLASGFEAVLAYYDRLHGESRAIFATFSDEDFEKSILTPTGTKIRLWKWLRAMLEHEIHHRGQLYFMLGLQDIPTPPIFGLTSEAVRNLAS